MKKNLYSIYDRKSNNFEKHFWMDINDECAIRTITNITNSLVPSELSENPEDYQLYKLGEIDLETGKITPMNEFLKNVVELKRPEDKKKDEILKQLRNIFDEVAGVKK